MTLWLVELLLQLEMQNMTTKCSDVINYKNSKNNYALIIAYNFHKTRCRQTYRQADVVTYRAAIAAKMQNLTTDWSNNLSYNNTNNIYTLLTAKLFYKTRCWQTDRQTEIVTYRAAIAATNRVFKYHRLKQQKQQSFTNKLVADRQTDRLTLWPIELLSQLKMQNVNT